MFLIQNSQETEEALEELRQKLEETKSKMTSETSSLAQQITTLQVSIYYNRIPVLLLQSCSSNTRHAVEHRSGAEESAHVEQSGTGLPSLASQIKHHVTLAAEFDGPLERQQRRDKDLG